jgi:hypothetical protein
LFDVFFELLDGNWLLLAFLVGLLVVEVNVEQVVVVLFLLLVDLLVDTCVCLGILLLVNDSIGLALPATALLLGCFFLLLDIFVLPIPTRFLHTPLLKFVNLFQLGVLFLHEFLGEFEVAHKHGLNRQQKLILKVFLLHEPEESSLGV